MAEPIYKIDFTVTRANPSVPPTVTPTDAQSAGYYGDDKVALVTFALSEVVDGHRYRIEIVDGNGAYDITELLDAVDGVVSYTIPAAWTAAGTATLQLVEIEIGEDGAETAVAHYPPGRLLFNARDNTTPMVEVLPQWQGVMTKAEVAAERVEAAAEVIENAEDAAELASRALEEADEALKRAQGTNRVYFGGGDMPDEYDIQIDYTDDTGVQADYVVEQGTDGIWTYRKWASGIAECWGVLNAKIAAVSPWGSTHYYGKLENVSFPDSLFVNVPAVSMSASDENGNFFVTNRGITAQGVGEIFAVTVVMVETAVAIRLTLEAKGRWKE